MIVDFQSTKSEALGLQTRVAPASHFHKFHKFGFISLVAWFQQARATQPEVLNVSSTLFFQEVRTVGTGTNWAHLSLGTRAPAVSFGFDVMTFLSNRVYY